MQTRFQHVFPCMYLSLKSPAQGEIYKTVLFTLMLSLIDTNRRKVRSSGVIAVSIIHLI
ncbi:hypothetical protein N9I19_17915 [Peribacillus sp. CSMR9]|nr:hypothetical protein [Peribacillus sp. CSMR9]